MASETQIVNDLFKLFGYDNSAYVQWFNNKEVKKDISATELNELHQNNLDEIVSKQLWEQPDPYALLYLFKCMGDVQEFLNQDVVNFYLRFLTNSSPRLDFYIKIFNQIFVAKNKKPISIENEVYRTVVIALKKGIWQNELQLSQTNNNENYKNTEQLKELLNYRLNLIAEWFLRRYQIFAAYRIYRLRYVNKDKISENLPSRIIPNIFIAIIFIITAILIHWSFSNNGFDLDWGLGIGLGIPAITWSILRTRMVKEHSVFRLFLPRQLGAIVAGYFLLIIVGAEYWDFLVRLIKVANKTCIYLLPAIPFSLLILIFFYLCWEVRSQLGFYSRKEVWKLALVVLIIGMTETMLFGTIFFNLAGPHMQSLFNDHKYFLSAETLCIDQLSFIATYMSLTLFVGIFLQIFWQDEPITVSL